MSMTGSGNEEETANSSEKLTNEATKASGSTGSQPVQCFSPMLGIFGRKELVPRLLEYEKALLVLKEHSYARAPERPEVLQLTSLHTSELNEQRRENEDINTLLNARSDLLQLRESLSDEKSEPSVVGHLRQVIGLQVALVREQQEQLHEKDRELNAVKKEKEQLEARLERMERRLAILQKHSRLKGQTDPDSPITSPTTLAPSNSLSTPIRTHLTRRESIIASELDTHSRSSSVEPSGRGRSKPSSRAGSPSSTTKESESVKRSHKRKIKEVDKDEKTPRKRTKHKREFRTDFEYRGLELPIPKRTMSRSEASPLPDHNGADTPMSEVSLNERVPGACVDTQCIVTPSWKLSTVGEALPDSTADCEDMSDDAFNRRHKKPEEDEKRRKRWDIQRARTLREHHELLRKYNMKSGEKGPDKKETEKPLTTFIPDLTEIDTIELMDTVTVSAFGRPLPVIKPSEFELPWFDLDVREAKESVRTTRSKARTNRVSVGGSADEL